MKILWKGPVFNPTGIATANREIIKELSKLAQVQVTDPWQDKYDFNLGLENLNNSINVKDAVTIFSGYPQDWKEGYGKLIGHPIHEGTRIFPDWVNQINQCDKIFVCSNANKNLYKWNGIMCPIEVINYGTNFDLYKPEDLVPEEHFTFLSVNSWSGNVGDRKGTDMLIKAFDEEFKPEEKVKLVLKISTFWQAPIDYGKAIYNILGHNNENILWNSSFVPEKDLVEYYQKADCFVAPTKGEGFGLTILNSLAIGCPVIVTKDRNSGHMDFCIDNPGVLWIDAPTVKQGDPRFYVEGNMLAEPDLNSLKKQMRYAFENRDKLLNLRNETANFVREKNFSWKRTAEKILEFIENEQAKRQDTL